MKCSAQCPARSKDSKKDGRKREDREAQEARGVVQPSVDHSGKALTMQLLLQDPEQHELFDENMVPQSRS